MAKRRTAKRRAATRPKGTNLDRLLKGKAIDPLFAKALTTGMAKVEKLTKNEVKALISAHKKVSPKKRWQPDPDGSIF